MRRSRAALAGDFPLAARRAADLLPLERMGRFAVVAGYHPVGAELDPRPLMDRFAAAGSVLALPAAVDAHAPLVFRLAGELARFVPDALGILAPPPSAEAVTPDLIIAPVLAFDRRGGRLGQGAGCYDRTLEHLRQTGRVLVIGLAYAGQEIEQVPIEPHDQCLDAILTENGYIEV